uniref:dolichol kinase n=2 Tax=Ceratitis capitata TaxID=7213 RepID=W8ATC5_CERCA
MVTKEGRSSAESNEVTEESKISDTGNGKALLTRQNASPGYWLCVLLPIAFISNFVHGKRCSELDSTQPILAIAAIGMSIENFCLFGFMFRKTDLPRKILIAFVPGLFTTLLYKILLQQFWKYSLLLGFATTFCYQNTYIRILRGLPGCFSYGEAAVLIQGLILFLLNVILKIPDILSQNKNRSDFAELNVIMMVALTHLLGVCWLLAVAKIFRKPSFFYTLMFLLLIAVTCVPVTNPIPIIVMVNFILKDKVRLKIICLYMILVVLTVLTVWWQSGIEEKASTRVRKIFHIFIALVYVPGIIYQCSFLYIATGVAFSIFTVIELIRICNIPPLALATRKAFATFSDEKDSGLLALTPFCLLIGCSIPIWISPCPCGDTIYTKDIPRILPLLSGILTIGFGDTAASVIGSKFGRIKWRGTKKSLEGTLSYIAVIMLAIMSLNYLGFVIMTPLKWCIAVMAVLTTSLVEAHTDQIDNLTLPIIFYTIMNIS